MRNRRTPRSLAATLVLFLLGALAACSGSTEPETGPPLVVTTTGMIADLVSEVGGSEVRVESLMSPGVDPHLYKASEGDVRRLASAKLVLYNGLHLEGKMTEILEKMRRGRPVVAIAGELDTAKLLTPEEYEGGHDPHVWFDVALWSETIDIVERELVALLPEHEEAFRTRAAEVRAEWTALEAWVREQLDAVPEARRVLVTAHDAFGYFGAAYGFEVVGIQGLSTVTEASLQDMERVVTMVSERGIPAIFVESSVSPRAIEAVQSACRERGHEVAVGGELFSDSMGAPGTPEGTYVGMVRHNVTTLVEALR